MWQLVSRSEMGVDSRSSIAQLVKSSSAEIGAFSLGEDVGGYLLQLLTVDKLTKLKSCWTAKHARM